MTAHTARFAIPYPEATDSPCDLLDQLGEAMNLIGSLLADVEARIYADVRMNATRVHVGSTIQYMNDYMDWETVDFDPNGIVNLLEDPATVILGEEGLMMVGGWYGIATVSDGVGHFARVGYQAGCGVRHSMRDTAVTGGGTGSYATLTPSSSTVYAADLLLAISTSATSVTTTEGTMYILRVSD